MTIARRNLLLNAIARSGARSGSEDIPWNSDLCQALAGEFQVEAGADPVSGGELARQALLVLAEGPETRKAIETMVSRSEEGLLSYDFGATIALTVAVLFVLQTHINFERRPDGTWSLQVEKNPTSDALLKGLVQKLIGFAK